MRVLAVPEGQAEAEALLVVGNAGDAVFAPAVGARAGVIVGEEVPGVAVLAVVLAHGAPLPFAEVRSPLLPGGLLLARLVQSDLFCCHIVFALASNSSVASTRSHANPWRPKCPYAAVLR